MPQLFARLEELRRGDVRLADLAAPLITVDADLPVSDVIDAMQSRDQELAMVKENGEMVGPVTITDTFEAIAGDLRDPLD